MPAMIELNQSLLFFSRTLLFKSMMVSVGVKWVKVLVGNVVGYIQHQFFVGQ